MIWDEYPKRGIRLIYQSEREESALSFPLILHMSKKPLFPTGLLLSLYCVLEPISAFHQPCSKAVMNIFAATAQAPASAKEQVPDASW